MNIVDTHLHLMYRDRFSYPWLAGVPPLNRDFHLEDYRAQAEAAGITAMIHMEVDAAEKDALAEAQFTSALDPKIVGVVASCRPERADFPDQLEKLAAVGKVRGLRRVLHTSSDELSAPPIFAENLRRLPGYDYSFDLCVLARQIPIATQLARLCPGVQFILDHCGVPDVKGQALDPWRSHIAEIARLPNVACKISGIVAYADPQSWTTEDLRPFFEHAVSSFGWDRVVWGSDWPVCTLTADLSRWAGATHELLAGASADEESKLLSRNAQWIYRLHKGVQI